MLHPPRCFRRRVALHLAALGATASGLILGAAGAAAAGPGGYDISWPQCPGPFPSAAAFGIVGVSAGLPYSHNPCFGAEFAWARRAAHPSPGLYMNLSNPGSSSRHWNRGGPRSCSGLTTDAGCAYDYGWMAATDAGAFVRSQVGRDLPGHWWLDVETTNSWQPDLGSNAADIQGALDALRARGATAAGVYSTPYQWRVITGGYGAGRDTRDWLAGARSAAEAAAWCRGRAGFSGTRRISVVQYAYDGFDGDQACGRARHRAAA